MNKENNFKILCSDNKEIILPNYITKYSLYFKIYENYNNKIIEK